jgi:hypothetical protein
MKTSFFKRWAPILGGLYVSAITIIEAFGLEGVAATVKTLGGLLALDSLSPVTSSELLGAAALLSGLIIKITKVVRVALEPEPVSDPGRLIGK